MNFTFLGTSAGTPTKARNVTALALQHGGPKSWYLIDCGEGTQHRLLHTRHSLQSLRAIFITHVHGDHCFGLPGLLASASMAGREESLPIIAPGPIRTFVQTSLEMSGSTLGYELEFVDTAAPDFHWHDRAVGVTGVPLSHRVPCYAYVFSERDRPRKLLVDRLEAAGVEPGPAWGQLQRGQDVSLADGRILHARDFRAPTGQERRLIVGGDNDDPDLLRDACEGVQVLIHEATYTQKVADRVGPGPQHSSAARVARFAESAGLPNLVLTHFSPRYQFVHESAPLIEEVAAEARQFYHGNLQLAQDFAEYQLNRDLSLVKISPEGRAAAPGPSDRQ